MGCVAELLGDPEFGRHGGDVRAKKLQDATMKSWMVDDLEAAKGEKSIS